MVGGGNISDPSGRYEDGNVVLVINGGWRLWSARLVPPALYVAAPHLLSLPYLTSITGICVLRAPTHTSTAICTGPSKTVPLIQDRTPGAGIFVWANWNNTSQRFPHQHQNKTVGFGQQPRPLPLHSRYTRTGTCVRW
jgi:hypothetical protein